MRTWLKTSVNSFRFPWIAGSGCRFLGWIPSTHVRCRNGIGSLFGWKSKGKTRPPGKQSHVGRREKRCLWSLSKWGAFARLGRGGENEWEASCEADRHTCRWIIWQQGQVIHHCRIHVHHLDPPRCKSVDSIQSLVLLERTKAGWNVAFGSPVLALLCFRSFETYWADSCLLGVACAALTLQTTSVCGTVCKLAPWTPGCSVAGRSHRQNDQICCCESIHHQTAGYRYKLQAKGLINSCIF